MSIPRRHHYLPEFFLRRWAVSGKVWRFERLLTAPGQPVHARQVAVSAAANEKDLYADPTVLDAAMRQEIEAEFFSRIDDAGARALGLIDRSVLLPIRDRAAWAQFVVSLIHRSPSRIDWMFEKLQERLRDDGMEGASADLIRSTALQVMTTVVSSGQGLSAVANFGVHRVSLAKSRFDLLLSDRPVMLSNGIGAPDGFLMLPIGPRELMVLTKNKDVASAFSTQKPTALARAVNDAVVRQAQHVVIASDRNHQRFIERRFLKAGRKDHSAVNPLDGMMRWQVP